MGYLPLKIGVPGTTRWRHAVRGGQIVGLVIGHRREIRRDVLANLFEVRFREGLDARGNGLVAQNEHRHVVFARDVDGFNGGVEAVLDIRRRHHHARRVAMAAEAGDVQVGLLDLRRHAGGRAAALDVHHHQRHFRHDGPAERFHLQRDARPAGAGDRHPPGVAGAHGHRDGRNFVLALDERAAVLRQFAAQNFHDIRPGRDRIARAEPDARGNQAVGQGFVAVHHDLDGCLVLALDELKGLDHVAERVAVAGMKRGQRVVSGRSHPCRRTARSMSFSSLAVFRSNIRATKPSAKMFLPLSLAVPPMASTVRLEIGTPT